MIAFTKQERLVLLFLAGVICSGGVVRLVFAWIPSASAKIIFLDEKSTLGRLDLNAATVDDLRGLPGIGPGLAQRIVDDRAAHGRFVTLEDLRRVPGMGAKTFSRITPYLRTRR